jgi:hypothetical protein
MSEAKNKTASAFKTRRLLVRLGLLLVYLAAIALSVNFGKVHTILVDNRDSGELTALDGVTLSVDGQESLELYAGDRDRAVVKGQRHSISIDFITAGNRIERQFTLPFGEEMVLLSLPKVVAGKEPYWEHFVPLDVAPPPGESVGNSNEFTSPDAVAEPGSVSDNATK